jgi:hypothetical protein
LAPLSIVFSSVIATVAVCGWAVAFPYLPVTRSLVHQIRCWGLVASQASDSVGRL